MASRIANLLEGGTPVEDLAQFQKSNLILIYMPLVWLDGVVDELLESGIDMRGKSVLLCDSDAGSERLEKLAHMGAHVASLSPVEGCEDRLFVVEGDRVAIRHARALLVGTDCRVTVIDRAKKALYSAGVCFAGSLALPLLTACVETFRASGMGQNEAVFVAEKLFLRTLRSYLKAGRKGWEGALPAENHDGIRKQVNALFSVSPLLASYYFENASMALQMFRRDAEWLHDALPVMPKAAGE